MIHVVAVVEECDCEGEAKYLNLLKAVILVLPGAKKKKLWITMLDNSLFASIRKMWIIIMVKNVLTKLV